MAAASDQPQGWRRFAAGEEVAQRPNCAGAAAAAAASKSSKVIVDNAADIPGTSTNLEEKKKLESRCVCTPADRTFTTDEAHVSR